MTRDPDAPDVLSDRERRILAAICDAMVPAGGSVAPGAVEVGVPQEIERWLTTFTPASRRAVRAMLTGFDVTPLASRHHTTFTRLAADERARWIEGSAPSRVRPRREAFSALQTLVQIAYASAPTVAAAIGYDGEPLVPLETRAGAAGSPGQSLPVLTWPDVPPDVEVDVVVVGSGAGGAVAAATLAAAGLSVLVLEEGGPYRIEDETTSRPVDKMLRLFRDNGLTFALGSPTISLPMGRAVGGTTVVNSGTCFRTPDDVLAAWSHQGIPATTPDDLAPVFDDVEATLGVQPVPDDVLGANGAVMRRGAEALGWSGGPIRRNIGGCHGHGTCGFGCPIDAKTAMHVSYLPAAAAAGARIVAHARVERLWTEAGQAVGVVATLADPATGTPRGQLRVRARATVLAAGAVFSPALLLRQGLATASGQLGRNLVVHPGAGTSAVFDEELWAWRGTMQSYYVDEHLADGVLLEATFPPPGLGYSAGSLPGWGRDQDLLGLYPRVASIGSICSDAGNGRVRPVGRSGALISYRLSARDAGRLVDGIARAAEVFFAAGATTVYPMLPGLEAVTGPEEVDRIRSGRWRRSELHVSAYHPMGTARMGADPSGSVVDAWGRVWDVPGLWILDASIIPSSTHVNPQVTIMALAARGAARLADQVG